MSTVDVFLYHSDLFRFSIIHSLHVTKIILESPFLLLFQHPIYYTHLEHFINKTQNHFLCNITFQIISKVAYPT